MEFRRATLDGELVSPGHWAGPFPSGAPAIFASVAARLGAPTALAACVGDDAFGRALIERLRRDGVDDQGIVTAPGRATRGRPRRLSRERRARLLVLGPRLRRDGPRRGDGRAAGGPRRLAPRLRVDAGVRRRPGTRDRGRRRAGARARRPAVARPERADQRRRAPARERRATGALGARPVPLRGRARDARSGSAGARRPRRRGLRDPRARRRAALRSRRAGARPGRARGRGRPDRRGRHLRGRVRRPR